VATKVYVVAKKLCTQVRYRPEIFGQFKPEPETRPDPKSLAWLTTLAPTALP